MYDGKANIELDALRSGVYCENCYEALKRVGKQWFNCPTCNEKYDFLKVSRRLIDELKILNSDWPINSVVLSKYSGYLISSSYIKIGRASCRERVWREG